MSAPIVNNVKVKGAVKISGLLDRECFSSWRDFLESLPRLLTIDIPTRILGVVFSKSEPGEDSNDVLWVNRDASGQVVGIYAFQNGKWEPLYTFGAGQIHWFWGDSTTPERGFKVILPGDTEVPSSIVGHIVPLYKISGAGRYEYFAARYIGF